MLPSALHLRNLRCFKDEHDLELRPLTLVYGANNVGKSVLVRALPLLADTLLSRNEPLALSSSAAREASFDSLLCQLPSRHDEERSIAEQDAARSLGLGLEWSRDDRDDLRSAYFDWIGDGPPSRMRVPVVKRFECSFQDGESLRLERVRRPERQGIGYRLSSPPGDRATEQQTFDEDDLVGPLLGSPAEGYLAGRLLMARTELERWARSVTWLTAGRRPALERLVQERGGKHAHLTPDGHNVLDILTRNHEVRRRVSGYFEELVGWRLQADDVAGKGYEFTFRRHRSGLDIPLGDVGEGLIQALPILTALALMGIDDEARVMVLEEPESHQHGDLQKQLGLLIGRLIAGQTNQQLIIETHSEILLLTIQLMIARGELSPDDVIMYWVRQLEDGRSIPEPVRFDEDAHTIGTLPRRPFSEDRDLTRRILQARRDRTSRGEST